MSRIARVPVLLAWLVLGLALILIPWSDLWETNYFLYQYPALGLFVKSPFLRGAVSGLGFMDVLFALEAFRRRMAVANRT
ncbi:MAG: hypothetical protein ABSE45_13590 [Candidatus Acidiferrales bacterium]|jgi:hypothetical protein